MKQLIGQAVTNYQCYFVVQNNKYAISVPVIEQSGGKDNSIAEMMSGFENLKRIRVDGTDFLSRIKLFRRH